MIPTPHISAQKQDFAKTVIMPGDPLRSKMIAETFLTDVKLVNNVRSIQGYTGYYNGKKVSVMASGMGNPTMGIYSYELFKFYDIDKIIRVGSIGAMQSDLKIKDVIISKSVFTNTNYDNFYIQNGENFVHAKPQIVEDACKIADKLSIKYHVGNTLCSDTFYSSSDEMAIADKHDLLGVEMESASLYINANRLDKSAITICTVSNNLITGEETTSDERQNAFVDMVKLALELA